MSGRLLITKSEAAEQLGVSVRTIERLISAGLLPLVHVEGAARVRVDDLGAYVQGLDPDQRTTTPSAKDGRPPHEPDAVGDQVARAPRRQPQS